MDGDIERLNTSRNVDTPTYQSDGAYQTDGGCRSDVEAHSVSAEPDHGRSEAGALFGILDDGSGSEAVKRLSVVYRMLSHAAVELEDLEPGLAQGMRDINQRIAHGIARRAVLTSDP